jgi:hypothetical protein
MECHSVGVRIRYRPFNFNMLRALKLLVVEVICLDWNLELASRRVVDLCGVARYVRCVWLSLVFVALFFDTRMVATCLCRLEP